MERTVGYKKLFDYFAKFEPVEHIGDLFYWYGPKDILQKLYVPENITSSELLDFRHKVALELGVNYDSEISVDTLMEYANCEGFDISDNTMNILVDLVEKAIGDDGITDTMKVFLETFGGSFKGTPDVEFLIKVADAVL